MSTSESSPLLAPQPIKPVNFSRLRPHGLTITIPPLSIPPYSPSPCCDQVCSPGPFSPEYCLPVPTPEHHAMVFSPVVPDNTFFPKPSYSSHIRFAALPKRSPVPGRAQKIDERQPTPYPPPEQVPHVDGENWYDDVVFMVQGLAFLWVYFTLMSLILVCCAEMTIRLSS